MHKMTQISLRLEDTVKTEAEELFSRLGMSLSTAINIFLRRAIARRGLPFAVEEEDPFYHPANQAFLKRALEDWKRGENFHHHDLLPDE